MEEEKIIGGIVTYNPNIHRLKENIFSLKKNGCSAVVIVDNNSNNKRLLNEIKSEAHIIFLEKNMGIAFALNEIFSFCEKNEYKWCLTMDQDSILPLGFVEAARKVIEPDIGIIAPLDLKQNFDKRKIIEMDKVITSGSLTSVYAWKMVGGFDDDFFIDYVDFDFCASLRRAGFHIYRLNDFILDHELGNAQVHKLFGHEYTTYNHSAFRTYYFVRNCYLYIKKNADVIDSKKEKTLMYKWILLKLIFEKNKIAIIKSIIKGYCAAKKESLNNSGGSL